MIDITELYTVIVFIVLYGVIRIAVHHGIKDARKSNKKSEDNCNKKFY
ncbi:MAG: hypothetical protein ACRCX2_08230 [Paraclostridium sp.]